MRLHRVRAVGAADRAGVAIRPRRESRRPRRLQKVARGSAALARRDAARPLPGDSEEVRRAPASGSGPTTTVRTSASRDEEIDRGFEIAKALGAEIITASATLESAKKIAPFAEKHRMVVAMHNHSNTKDPNEFATPESFAAAMKLSKYFKVNLDIGHFTAANYDAVAFLKEHHANVTNLHIKDRKKNQGDNVPWGTGDTPIREVLQLLKREKWPIRAYMEYEHRGTAGAGRRSEDLLRLRQTGARMTARRKAAIGMGWSARALSVRTTSTRCGGSASSMSSRSPAAPRNPRAERPTRWACRSRTAATKRSPAIRTSTSSTTRRRTICTRRSSWPRSPIASTSCPTSRWR